MVEESEAAEPNQTTGATSLEDAEALLDAARYGDLEDLMILATAGVSLGSKDKQDRTALHMAAANGHLVIVDYLIGRGVDVNATNLEKNTPLHLAFLNCIGGKEFDPRGSRCIFVKQVAMSALQLIRQASRGKMEVIDTINTAAAQLELVRAAVS